MNRRSPKARVSEAQRGPINHVVQVRLLDSRFVFDTAGYANRQSGQTQNLVLVGSTPTSATVFVSAGSGVRISEIAVKVSSTSQIVYGDF